MAHISADPPPRYTERLAVPWWWWPVTLGVAALLGAELALAMPTAPGWLSYALLIALGVLLLWRLGRLTVAVCDGELRVDDARLPVGYVAGVTVLDPDAKALVLGPHAEQYAFVVQRPWIRGAIMVELDDPADPTPYWVVSSRRPETFAAALHAARAAAPTVPTGPSGRTPPAEPTGHATDR